MMTLRQEAIELAATIPEKYLLSAIGLMQSFKDIPDGEPQTKIDFTKYMNRGKKMFTDSTEIDDYVEELRRERF